MSTTPPQKNITISLEMYQALSSLFQTVPPPTEPAAGPVPNANVPPTTPNPIVQPAAVSRTQPGIEGHLTAPPITPRLSPGTGPLTGPSTLLPPFVPGANALHLARTVGSNAQIPRVTEEGLQEHVSRTNKERQNSAQNAAAGPKRVRKTRAAMPTLSLNLQPSMTVPVVECFKIWVNPPKPKVTALNIRPELQLLTWYISRTLEHGS